MDTTCVTKSIIFLIFVLFNLYPNKAVAISDQTFKQQVEPNKHNLETMRPSFTNGNSYIYLLGLFLQERTSFLKHFQTVAEPAMFRAAIIVSQMYNITVNGKQFAYRIEETSGRDVIDALDHTCLAISENKVLGIVGPEYSSEAKTISRFANRAGLPVIGYSTTDPELSNRNAYHTFYRLPPSDVVAAQALLKLYQKYNWNSTNIIYQSDNYGEGGLKALTEVFNNEITISRAIKYDLFTNRIDNLQRELKESPSRIVVVWATADVATNIIESAIEVGNILAPSFLWILVAANTTMEIADNPNVDQLSGMLMLRLVTPSLFDIPTNKQLLRDATAIWKKYDPQSYPADERQIGIFELYAFDAAWLLILAIEKLCQQNPNTCLSFMSTASCFSSRLVNSDQLNQIIQTMNFTGVSGYVQFQSNTTDRINSTIAHYIIDNLQPSTTHITKLQVVEVLKFNGSMTNIGRKSVPQWIESGPAIRWPNKSPEPPSAYACLQGTLVISQTILHCAFFLGETLNITVYRSPPFFMTKPGPNNSSQPLGYIDDLISLLQKRMGFKYNYVEAPMEVSYDELVECVQNHTYEILMADLAITSSRTDKVDFSYPIYDNTMVLVVRKSKTTTISTFAFLKPFVWQLWLLIACGIYLFSALLIALYESSEKNGNIYHKNIGITSIRSLYHTTGALLQRGSELQPTTFFGRFQTVVVWMMSVILVALLTSNLTAYLNAQREKPWLQSIDDLRMCRNVACDRIGIVEGSHHEEYFRNEVMNGFPMNYYHLKHPDECYTKLLDYHIDVAIADSSSAYYFTQTSGYCGLEVTGIPFGRTYFGIALPKEWPYKEDLDDHIMELKLNGEIDRLLAKWFQQKNCDHENDDKNNGLGDGLTILEASGLFYIFASFTLANLFIFVFKQLYDCRKTRSPTAANQDEMTTITSVDEQNGIELPTIGNLVTASTENREETHF